jgi:ABC-type bacteriocin/lantibiotic exporter with double-glycine peptidase domain
VACSAILFYAYSDILTSATPDPAHPPMSTGDFVAFLTAFTQMMTAALGFAAAFNSVVAVAPAYERARPILEAVPETAGDRSQPGELQGHIEVRHVSFSYGPDSPPILKDVSLTIEPGMFAAIVGPSGSGKSTLLRMLLAFEMPDSGAIYFDRQDIANLDARAVRRQIGVVLQNGRIRAGSILDNIIGTARLTVDDAWEAARMAGFDADVEAMPMGMQTVLGEGGGTLSGGQRQRLLIARALVRRPRIVFFDEATSALDNQTQAIVSRSLDNLRATRVVIAHRLSTIERADRIYVMERGRLVEEGNYAELMARGGRFAELARRQIA